MSAPVGMTVDVRRKMLVQACLEQILVYGHNVFQRDLASLSFSA